MAHDRELFSRSLRARTLAYLFIGGALIGILTLISPHDPRADDGALYALAAGAVAIGLAVLWRAESIPDWAQHVALATGSGILVAANYFVGPSGIYLILFTWTALYAFYFYSLPVACAHMAVIGVGYLVVLLVQEPPSPGVRWILAVGTPGLAGVMVSRLLARLRAEGEQSARRDEVLRENEARTRAIVESAPDAFLGVSEDGTVLSWNPAAERVFGWAERDALGRPAGDLLLRGELLETHGDRLRDDLANATGRPHRRRMELVRRDGTRFSAEVTTSRVEVSGRPMLACFIQDLTDAEQRELQQEQLYREQVARREAEQMAGMVHGLQQLLDVALAYGRLDDMLDALMPRICEVVDADVATVLLIDDDGSLTVAASTGGPLEGEPIRVHPGEGLAGRVLVEREPLLVDDPGEGEFVDPRLRGLTSILSVPLLANKELAGVLQVGVPPPRRLTDDDLLLLSLAADRVGLAIDHLRVYEREHRIAETLQRSLLPERLPRLPALEVAARYMPAASESEVGGDWYDVIAMPGGRVGLVMGDVAGKGLQAASMVGRLRNAMHAYALEGHGPADVVERLNRLAWSEEGESQMTTLLYVVCDPWGGRVEWVNAGHLPPIAVGPDGAARYLDGPSSVPLGVVGFPKYRVARADVPLGSTVVLYTDGLVERPGEVLDTGLARLVAAVQGERVGPEQLCDRVLGVLVPTGGASDDVALLALRSPRLSDSFRLELSSNPSELAAMRAMMRRWLRDAGVGEDEIAEILTATGEAAANAIEHGSPAARAPLFEVAGALADGELEVVVSDSGQWREGARADGGRGLVLMRALMGEVTFDTGDDGTTVTMRRRVGAGLAGQPVVR